MTEEQNAILAAAADGRLLTTTSETVRETCEALVAMKMLRHQTFIDGNAKVNHAKIMVGYQITGAGTALVHAGK